MAFRSIPSPEETYPDGGPSAMARCPHCGVFAYRNERFCPCCGGALLRRCPGCGERIWHPIANFCSQCGIPLGDGSPDHEQPR